MFARVAEMLFPFALHASTVVTFYWVFRVLVYIIAGRGLSAYVGDVNRNPHLHGRSYSYRGADLLRKWDIRPARQESVSEYVDAASILATIAFAIYYLIRFVPLDGHITILVLAVSAILLLLTVAIENVAFPFVAVLLAVLSNYAWHVGSLTVEYVCSYLCAALFVLLLAGVVYARMYTLTPPPRD